MNEERLARLEILERTLSVSKQDCNPIEYIQRQTKLLYVVSDYILEELREYDSEEAQKNSFATMNKKSLSS